MGLFNFKNKAGSIENSDKDSSTESRDTTVSSALVRGDADKITSDEDERLFTKTIGDEYVAARQLELSEEEWNRMSITDGAEMLRLYSWYHSKVVPDDTEEKSSRSRSRMEHLCTLLASKILSTDEIYCLYNKRTGEPHLFSGTLKQDEGYLCTPPDILYLQRHMQIIR